MGNRLVSSPKSKSKSKKNEENKPQVKKEQEKEKGKDKQEEEEQVVVVVVGVAQEKEGITNQMGRLTTEMKQKSLKFNNKTRQASTLGVREKLTDPELVKTRMKELVISPNENHALVFLKPHAANEKVKRFVQEFLIQKSCFITSEGVISAEVMNDRSIVDKHYAAIAKNAMMTSPADIFLTTEKIQEFEDKFQEDWEKLQLSDRLMNLKDFKKRMPKLSTDTIDEIWSSKSTLKLKLGPGNYCGRMIIEGNTFYVINAFYGSMRDMYTLPGCKVIYFTVEWDEELLSWQDFRKNVIGATNPKEAVPTSLRALLSARYREFDIESEPNTGLNCVHASAGPIEALKERMTWLDLEKIHEDPFGRVMLDMGVPEVLIRDWCENVPTVIEGREGPAFDLLEDLNSSIVIGLALQESKVRQMRNELRKSKTIRD